MVVSSYCNHIIRWSSLLPGARPVSGCHGSKASFQSIHHASHQHLKITGATKREGGGYKGRGWSEEETGGGT